MDEPKLKSEEDLTFIPYEDRPKLALIVNNIESSLFSIKRNIYEIGKELSRAKHIPPHATFQNWIEYHFAKELLYSTVKSGHLDHIWLDQLQLS